MSEMINKRLGIYMIILSTSITLCVTVQLGDIQDGYWARNTYEDFLYADSVSSLVKKTKYKCARECLSTKYCVAFSHSKFQGLCHMFVHTEYDGPQSGTPFNGMRHYRKRIVGCPQYKGYTLTSDDLVCLKLYTDRTNFTTATDRCQQDGGHLYLMDSAFKADTLQEYMKNSVNFEYFLGAERLPSGSFLSFRWQNGRPVDASSWKPNVFSMVTNTAKTCVTIRMLDFPNMGLTGCSKPSRFVCEIS